MFDWIPSGKRIGVVIAAVFSLLQTGGRTAIAQTGPDRTALAALRPGVDQKAVASAYGDSWRPPLPHREGNVLVLDMSDGVIARITTDGRLGSIRFNWRFGEEVPVIGIKMAAYEKELKARFPALDFSPMPSGPFSYPHLIDQGLPLKFEIGTTYEGQRYLRSIELYDPSAKYPPKQPVAYPPPQGAPGAPFKDVNLKLVVMQSLIDTGDLDIGEPQDLYDHVLGRPFDLEAEGYEPVEEARAYLARYPLGPDLLDKVTGLEFDGGSEIFTYINYFWGGESDEFDTGSFEGIEALRNLKSIRIISMVTAQDEEIAVLKASGIEFK